MTEQYSIKTVWSCRFAVSVRACLCLSWTLVWSAMSGTTDCTAHSSHTLWDWIYSAAAASTLELLFSGVHSLSWVFSFVFSTHVEQFLCMRDLVGQTPLHAGAGDKIIIWESEQTYRDPGAAQLESRTRCYRVFMCVPLYVAHCIICYCWGSRVLSSPDWILIQGRQRPSDTVTELNYWGCSVTGSVVACYEYSAAGQISSHSVLAVIGGSDEDMSRCRLSSIGTYSVH